MPDILRALVFIDSIRIGLRLYQGPDRVIVDAMRADMDILEDLLKGEDDG